MKNLFKILFVFMFSLFAIQNVRADYTINTNVNTSADPLAGQSGIITISAILNLDADYNLASSGITEIIITSTGMINYSGNWDLFLPANCIVTINTGGQIVSNLGAPPCNSIRRIFLGTEIFATCNGNGVHYTFAQVVANGGIFGFLSASADYNAPVCAGGSLTLSATPNGGVAPFSYNWNGPAGYNSHVQNPTINPVVTGTYTVTITDDGNVDATATTTVVTSTGYTPAVALAITAGANPDCAGSSVTFTATPTHGGTAPVYNFTVNNISAQSGSSNTFTTSALVNGDIVKCVMTANNPCQTTPTANSNQITMVRTSGPTGFASNVVICNGMSANIALNASVPGTTFTWTAALASGTVLGYQDCSSNCGTTIADILTGTNHASVAYTVTPAYNGCTGSTFTVSATIGGIPAAPAAITGPKVVCHVLSATYSVPPVPDATSYFWTVPGQINLGGIFSGMIIQSGQGTNSITVSVTAGTVAGNVTCTAGNNCGTGAAAVLAVNKKPFAITAIAGPVSLCGATTAIYSVTQSEGATSYLWTVPSGITVISGAGTTAIRVNVASTFVAGNISASAVNDCGYYQGVVKTVYGKVPTAAASIAGPVNVCGLTDLTYTASGGIGATGYVWTLPAGFTLVSATGASVRVTNTGFTTGSISVQGTNVCGTGAAKTLNLTVAAGNPAVISGPVVTCGITSAVYSIADVAGATSYLWSLPTGATIYSGQNTTSIVASFASPMIGNVTVSANNGCAPSKQTVLAVNVIPPTPGTITGPSVVCGLGTAAYSIAPVNGATGYLWQVTTGMTILTGQGTTGVTVSIGSGFPLGKVKVYAQSACGNSAMQAKSFGACAEPETVNVINENEFTLYPNPANRQFTIELMSDNNGAVAEEVYDVLGNLVMKNMIQINAGNSKIVTDIEQLQNGIYFVRLLDVDSNVLYTHKVVKE